MRVSYQRLFGTLAASSTLRFSLAFSPLAAKPKVSPLHLSASSMSTTTKSEETTSSHENLCLGGDFAGIIAKFNPKDGSLVPVPEYLVPEALLEWGQEPSALEVLTSEEWEGDAKLTRQEITVYPAVGCAVDNLETSKKETIVDQEVQSSHPSGSVLQLDATTSTKEDTTTRRLETQFSLPEKHRVRVAVDLKVQTREEDNTDYELLSPIVLMLERQTNTTSSGGTRADGGGLDGRTVSQLMGEWLRKSQTFAEKAYSPGEWQGKGESSDFTPASVIHLPGNITLSTGPVEGGDWVLEVGHYSTEESSSRRILQRKFSGIECETSYKEELGEYTM